MTEGLPTFQADEVQFQQVVMSFVNNACEALDGQENAQIIVRTGVDDLSAKDFAQAYGVTKPMAGQFVWLEVQDNGCGMDDETLKRIFEPFFTTKFTGRGLGLSAALGIIRAHEGAIMVKSDVRQGTTIRLLIPVMKNNNPLPIQENVPPIQHEPLSCRILVIDADKNHLEMVCMGLEAMGCEVLFADNAKDGLNLYRDHKDAMDVVLLNVHMPYMDGFHLLQELQRISKHAQVIVVSTYTKEAVDERLGGIDIAGFLHKPYEISDLYSVLRNNL